MTQKASRHRAGHTGNLHTSLPYPQRAKKRQITADIPPQSWLAPHKNNNPLN